MSRRKEENVKQRALALHDNRKGGGGGVGGKTREWGVGGGGGDKAFHLQLIVRGRSRQSKDESKSGMEEQRRGKLFIIPLFLRRSPN